MKSSFTSPALAFTDGGEGDPTDRPDCHRYIVTREDRLIKGQSSAIKDIKKKEDQVDELRERITDYLAALLARNI